MERSQAVWRGAAALALCSLVLADRWCDAAQCSQTGSPSKAVAASAKALGSAVLPPELLPAWLRDQLGAEEAEKYRFAMPPALKKGPITRGELAIAAEALLSLGRNDLLAADYRWQNDPKLTWREADPPHLADRFGTVRWIGSFLADPAWVEKTLRERAASSSGRDVPASGFKDVAGPLHQQQAITYLTQLGIFTGYPDQSFQENRNVSPAEFAGVQYRVSQEILRYKTGRCYLSKKASATSSQDAAGKP